MSKVVDQDKVSELNHTRRLMLKATNPEVKLAYINLMQRIKRQDKAHKKWKKTNSKICRAILEYLSDTDAYIAIDTLIDAITKIIICPRDWVDHAFYTLRDNDKVQTKGKVKLCDNLSRLTLDKHTVSLQFKIVFGFIFASDLCCYVHRSFIF